MWSVLAVPNVSSNLKAKLAYIKNKMDMVNAVYDKDSIVRYYEYIDIKHIKNSLSIEGTKVSEDDTRLIMGSLMPNNIEYRAFMECNNLCRAVYYMNYCISNNIALSYSLLLELHHILASNILSLNNSGHIRDRKVIIGRGNYEVAQINQIDKLLRQLFDMIDKIDNPIIKAAYFSYNMVSIHPFIDFNGRLSRLCESYILMQYGYPIITIEEKDINKYMTLIRDGQENGDSVNESYIDFVADRVLERIEEMLK